MTYDEPIYVDDPFEDEDLSWKYKADLPEEYVDLLEEAMRVTRRTSGTFRTPAEKRKWKTILGQVERGVIPVPWVNFCIEFAQKKNSRVNYGVAYTFITLTKYIQNKAAMSDWMAKNPDKVRRPDDYDVD